MFAEVQNLPTLFSLYILKQNLKNIWLWTANKLVFHKLPKCKCALEQGCLSHSSVLHPPFISPFLTPPPHFYPILFPPCGSSIYQPPWFSLYLSLWGSAAYIKYLETDGLVQQPSNLSTERESERVRQHEPGPFSLSLSEGNLRKSPKGRRAPFPPPGYQWACVGGHHRVNSAVWMSKPCGSQWVQRKTEKATRKNKRGRRLSVWCQCGRKSSN